MGVDIMKWFTTDLSYMDTRKSDKPLFDIPYKLAEDGMYYPDLEPIDTTQESQYVGKYGAIYREYLRNKYPAIFSSKIIGETLVADCLEMNEAVWEEVEKMMEQALPKYGVTEELKAQDQLKWVQEYNSVLHMVEEIVIADMIYGKA